MKALYRLVLLSVQLAVFVPLAIYLGSQVDITKADRRSVLQRRALDNEIYWLSESGNQEGNEGFQAGSAEYEGNRMVTARPATEADDENDLQVPVPLIPYGPDETPPRKPATIPTDFTIEEPDFCVKRPNLDIIAYVHSSISHVKQRKDTRDTWANASAYHLGVNIGVVFMVGRAKTAAEELILKQESEIYHDIVQGEYGDHYRLLSYKGLASIYWVNKHCSHVPWTLHADDDIFIDVFLYYQLIQNLTEPNKKKFICSHMYGPALRSGRWYVSYEQYPAKNYPLYCSGAAWFLRTEYLPRLLNASTVVPFLWVDDAYLTGLLAIEAGIERHGFQKYYGHPQPNLTEVGEKAAWFYLKQSRIEWWYAVVEFHRKKFRNSH